MSNLNIASSKDTKELLSQSIREEMVDFDKLFHLTYSFDVLKWVLDKIINEIDKYQDQNCDINNIILEMKDQM